MAITKEQVVNSGGMPVKIQLGNRTVNGKVYPMNGPQISGYLGSPAQQAYIQVEGEDPKVPRLYDLEIIDLL